MDGGFSDKTRPADFRSGGGGAAETEDFLYHLYRGSELLQDNRVLEAKEELENALRLQPRDAKGQDLLAVVYFRLGLYPRAIEIYEELCGAFPRDASLGKNLALCYLKTGQAERTRTLLEQVVRTTPDDLRAWSYLGLAYERLGEYEKARTAFERGQQHSMAKRMDGRIVAAPAPYAPAEPPVPSLRPSRMGRFQEILDGYGAATEEDGATDIERLSVASAPIAVTAINSAPSVAPPAPLSVARAMSQRPPPDLPSPAPAAAGQLVRDSLLQFPREPGLALHPNGLVLGRIADTFAARLAYVYAISTSDGVKTASLAKRIRNRDLGEPLGGADAPIVALSGADQLTLAPRQGRQLLALALDDDALYVRESAVVAFEAGLAYESGRLSPADAGPDAPLIPMVLLRGRGALVLDVARPPVALEVRAGRFCIVRRDAIIGWTGRLLCYEASNDSEGEKAGDLIRFAGDGALIVDPSPHLGPHGPLER